MFQFPQSPSSFLWIQNDVHGFFPCGFPHSDILGSMPAYGSPRLFVVSHVLLRLLAPRHPPCALSSLSFFAFASSSLSSCHGASFLYAYPLTYLLPAYDYIIGGPKRDRTADLLLARQALSQLSYGPTAWALMDSNHRPHPYQGCALTS